MEEGDKPGVLVVTSLLGSYILRTSTPGVSARWAGFGPSGFPYPSSPRFLSTWADL